MPSLPSSSFNNIEEAVAFYTADLPNPLIMNEEFCWWKTKWLAIPRENHPESISESLKECHQAKHLHFTSTFCNLTNEFMFM